MAELELLFNPEDQIQYGRDVCFLCGAALPVERDTDEHVIPKWVQNRFDLWNQRLAILNKTEIPYRQLTIPCCVTCNGTHLNKIETAMQKACDAGAQAVRDLPSQTVFIWLGKILYGLLYREHFLHWSRRDPNEGPIVDEEMLRRYKLHHQFLQAARIPFEFHADVPASIFVYETLEPADNKMRFDFRDNPLMLSISIRVGRVGIIACLQDGSAVKDSFGDVYKKYEKLQLHDIQFKEITARVWYDLSRFNRTPKFIIGEQNGAVQVFMNTLGGLSGKPLFEEGDLEQYGKMLAAFLFAPEDEITSRGKVMTWLHKPSGELNQMLADG
jgi:hypothetical protein